MEKLVNFPLRDESCWSRRGPGTSVKLVVCGKGGAVFDVLEGELYSDDRRPPPRVKDWASAQEVEDFEAEYTKWLAYHYPRIDNDCGDESTYVSRAYFASIVLGTTDSNRYEPESGYWSCTFYDLTDAGKALYKQIETIYTGCDLHLLTFLYT